MSLAPPKSFNGAGLNNNPFDGDTDSSSSNGLVLDDCLTVLRSDDLFVALDELFSVVFGRFLGAGGIGGGNGFVFCGECDSDCCDEELDESLVVGEFNCCKFG